MSILDNPIGVFDSGMGGLTVLKALKEKLPNESFIYLGDTARLPYGTKSPQTVMQYAENMTQLLLKHQLKILIIACNTATASALSYLQHKYPNLPIIGVIEPGARAAIKATHNHHYALLATETTIQSKAYQRKLIALDASANILTQSCGIFVALAEENCIDDQIARAAVEKYLSPVLDKTQKQGCIILGCTHFPVLADTIRQYIGPNMPMVDSATATAEACVSELDRLAIRKLSTEKTTTQYFVTDNPQRFKRIAPIFLNNPIDNVDLVNCHRYDKTASIK